VTTFLIVCAVMIVAALALVLVPLLRAEPAQGKDKASAPRAVPMAVVLMIALPLAASAFYGATTSFPWENPGTLVAGGEAHAQGGGSMDQVTAQLEQRLAQNPGDVEGWRMLGRTYLVSNRIDQAVAAYEKASALTGGNDAAVELDLAEALVLSDSPQAQERARGIIDAALAADQGNQKALWYSGVIASRSGDRETAIARFSKLLESNPPPQVREILVAQLSELGVTVPGTESGGAPAMGAAGAGMSGMGGSPAAAGTSGRTLRLSVSLDPALTAKLQPGATLFVSAREPGIPGPPLAAVRISSDELPATVVLSDANAMIEGRNLSSVDDVELVARVAFGGTAVTQSGDLLGTAIHKKGAASEVSVVIDRVAP
jgi:cytochrome c-type biogenesis protein CcmH